MVGIVVSACLLFSQQHTVYGRVIVTEHVETLGLAKHVWSAIRRSPSSGDLKESGVSTGVLSDLSVWHRSTGNSVFFFKQKTAYEI